MTVGSNSYQASSRAPPHKHLDFDQCVPRNIPSSAEACFRPRIMNSYPPELLAQLAPVMFVAGLGSLPPPTSPQSPAPKAQDPFSLLSMRLKDMLQAQRRPAVWQPDKSKTFQIVFVEPVRTQPHLQAEPFRISHSRTSGNNATPYVLPLDETCIDDMFATQDIRFPPRKMPPAEDQQFLPTHSPLSPLTPSSPLYPDGLIAPIWIRKHTTLAPSVFVLFKRIFEYQRPSGGTPLDIPDPDLDREREAEERRKDTELAQEIAQRKKSTNERSIKLTVVLMASRRMLGAYHKLCRLEKYNDALQTILRLTLGLPTSEGKAGWTRGLHSLS